MIRELLRKSTVVILISIFMIPSVLALGVGPQSLEVTVKKGEETTLTRYIGVSNPEEKPIHIAISVTDEIASFVTVSPQTFDLPAGPGIKSQEPRPYQQVTVTVMVPRDTEQGVYKGDIVMSQAPAGVGVLGATAQLSVDFTMTVGGLAIPTFPMYVSALIGILLLLTGSAVFVSVRERFG